MVPIKFENDKIMFVMNIVMWNGASMSSFEYVSS